MGRAEQIEIADAFFAWLGSTGESFFPEYQSIDVVSLEIEGTPHEMMIPFEQQCEAAAQLLTEHEEKYAGTPWTDCDNKYTDPLQYLDTPEFAAQLRRELSVLRKIPLKHLLHADAMKMKFIRGLLTELRPTPAKTLIAVTKTAALKPQANQKPANILFTPPAAPTLTAEPVSI